jgi:hypothetical protein
MIKEKTYKIRKNYHDRDSIVEGTLEEITKYFSYTLLVGNSYNPKIITKPKTIKSLMSNLNKSLDIKEGSCYNRTTLTLL